MTAKKLTKRRITQAEQSARFIDAAKKAEADENAEKFEKTLIKVARSKSRKGDSQ